MLKSVSMRAAFMAALFAAAVAAAWADQESVQSDPASAASPQPEPPAADISKGGVQQRHRPHRASPSGVEASVQRLTKALDLDGTQQARLREVLESERRRIREVWSNSAGTSADRTGPMLAILENTREQIRSMLTEEQRKKYQVTVPRDMTAPAQTDVDYWLRLTQPAGRKPGGKTE